MAGAQHTKEYKAVVTALVKLRSERGLSQTDLAQLLGRHRSYVAKVEICERRLDIVEFCKQRYNDVKHGRVTLEDIVKRGRVRRPLEEYKSIAGGIAGVCYYNEYINSDDPIDDSFFYIECEVVNGPSRITLPNGTERPVRYISVKEMKEFNEDFEIDWGAYAQKSIVQKAKPIFLAMGWDMKEFIVDENQQSLGKWL